jgi:hypothetical protein
VLNRAKPVKGKLASWHSKKPARRRSSFDEDPEEVLKEGGASE